jgi:opacity protein-like surface antigen
MKHAARKSFLVIVLAVLAAGSASAQEWFNSYAHSVDGDTLFVNAGVGVPPVSASAGARYFFTSFLGAYLELGYSGLQILGAGLTVKF